MGKKKILHIGFMFPTEGNPNQGLVIKELLGLYQELHPDAHQFFVHTYYKGNQLNPDLNGLEPFEYKAFKISSWIKFFQFSGSNSVTDYVNKISPDFIHFHNFFPGFFLLYPILIKKNIPFGISFRGSCLRALKFTMPWNSSLKWISKAKFIHFNSAFYKKKISEVLIKKEISFPTKVLIPNFLNKEWEDILPAQPSKFILIVAVCERRKNLHNVLKALKDLEVKIKDSGLRVKWIGNINDTAYFEQVKGYINHGFITHEVKNYNAKDLKEVFSESSFLISVPTKETFGMVYAEAISQNVPIIYSASAGISDFLSGNVGEQIDNPSDVEEIKSAILKLIHQKTVYTFEDKFHFYKTAVKNKWEVELSNI